MEVVRVVLLLGLASAAGCGRDNTKQLASKDSHERMLEGLREYRGLSSLHDPFLNTEEWILQRERLQSMSQVLPAAERYQLLLRLGELELRHGENESAIQHLHQALDLVEMSSGEDAQQVRLRLAVAYLRLGETQNCVHCQTGESCILPIRPGGVHEQRLGSEKAAEYCALILRDDPDNIRARWLLNIASMTLGRYPHEVPDEFRIPPERFTDDGTFPRFPNVAPALGLDTVSLLGGAVADDFDNDGLIDIMVSGWHARDQLRLFCNQGDGTFTDSTITAGLEGITGGGNLVQADYDNDGDLDVLVLRGGWRADAGRYPNSLLQNDGQARFRDVTFDAGLAREHYPCQTAAWGDVDLDGDLDLYIGNENFPAQLFMNDGNGVFRDQAKRAGVQNDRWAKGVVFGDFNADRYPDIYVSNYRDRNRLYRNDGRGRFADVAPQLGVEQPSHSFPAWFWDFNNDGVLDIFATSYQFDVAYVAAEYLDGTVAGELDHLYEGDGQGGFRNVSQEAQLHRVTQPMGANFGDLDNDGFLDFYLGTGYPEFDGLMPNLMHRNMGGERFVDVTVSGGFGHLQKGHGVAFADFDNDGDQDVLIQLGGAYPGDAFGNALFENPGFGQHWIRIKLVGRESNRSGIGARIRVELNGAGATRSVYRWVNSGGSFGANPLTQQIGVGAATNIETIEVFWPKTGLTQVFNNIAADQFIEIEESSTEYRPRTLKPFALQASSS